MTPSDPIRRGDVLGALARVGLLPEDAAMDAVRSIPADPVAAAAIRLAEATEANWPQLGGRVTFKMLDALADYRRAKEGRC